MRSHKILIVEDHPLIRRVFSELIHEEPGFTVCGEAENIRKALGVFESTKPDITLVDISLEGNEDGIELIKKIREKDATAHILAVSLHEEALYADRVLQAGAKGYIMKTEGAQYLVKAIRHVLTGGYYVSGKSGPAIVQKFQQNGAAVH